MGNRKKKNERSILYKKWQENHRDALEKEEIGRNIGISGEKIVVKKISTLARVLEILQEVFFKVARVFVYICITLLSSLGLTVVLNGELRTFVFGVLVGYLK